MSKHEVDLGVLNLTEKDIRQLAAIQSKNSIEMDGYLHKLYKKKNGNCNLYQWYKVLGIQSVDDLSLEKSLKLEGKIRKQLIKSNIKESEYRNKMIKALAYNGSLYNLYSANSETLLLIQWFILIGLYTYGYSKMNWNYYTTKEIEKFYLDTIRKVLELDIKKRIENESEQKLVISEMVDDKLVTISHFEDDIKDVYYTYVGSIVNEQIKVVNSFCKLVRNKNND